MERIDTQIPITVFTGFLGAGKTTLILGLLQQLPASVASRIVLLKNEYGDVATDSALATQSNIKVTEMTNGCLCCVLVGQMKLALEDIREKYQPERIIVETSGSAFPGPIAWQINDTPGFTLDAILTVVDCIHFQGYADTSYTAKLQAKYSDVILLNKWDVVTERQVDDVIERINELNDETPKVRVGQGGGMRGLSPELVFGQGSRMLERLNANDMALWKETRHAELDVTVAHIDIFRENATAGVSSKRDLEKVLGGCSPESVFRIKGFIRVVESTLEEIWIVNWAFGRCTFTQYVSGPPPLSDTELVKLTIMGLDEVVRIKDRLKTNIESIIK